MEINEFKGLVGRLYDSEQLTNEEFARLNYYASLLLDKMEAETIEYEEQNTLDEYKEFFDDGHSLAIEVTSNLDRYYRIISERQTKEKEKQAQHSKPYVIKPINKKGVVTTLAIIEATIIAGMVITAIAIVLMQK